MEHPNENLEYSVRFALKHSLDNIEKAVKIAMAKYRSIVKRQLRSHEIIDIKALVGELRNWQFDHQLPRSLVGF